MDGTHLKLISLAYFSYTWFRLGQVVYQVRLDYVGVKVGLMVVQKSVTRAVTPQKNLHSWFIELISNSRVEMKNFRGSFPLTDCNIGWSLQIQDFQLKVYDKFKTVDFYVQQFPTKFFGTKTHWWMGYIFWVKISPQIFIISLSVGRPISSKTKTQLHTNNLPTQKYVIFIHLWACLQTAN